MKQNKNHWYDGWFYDVLIDSRKINKLGIGLTIRLILFVLEF